MKNDLIQVSENISPKTLTKQLVKFQKSSDFQVNLGFFFDLPQQLLHDLTIHSCLFKLFSI